MAGSVEAANGHDRAYQIHTLRSRYLAGKDVDAGPLTPDETYQVMFGEPVQLPDLHPLGKALHNATEHIPHPHLHLRHPS